MIYIRKEGGKVRNGISITWLDGHGWVFHLRVHRAIVRVRYYSKALRNKIWFRLNKRIPLTFEAHVWPKDILKHA